MYRFGTISNIKLLAGLNRFYGILTSTSASALYTLYLIHFICKSLFSCSLIFSYARYGNYSICIDQSFAFNVFFTRKPNFCLCTNKGADQRLCFHFTDSEISLLLIPKKSSFLPSSVIEQADLCQTWSETQIVVSLAKAQILV